MNCWNVLIAAATLLLGNEAATRDTVADWAISSRATHAVEGSTTIPQGSRVQAHPKRATAVITSGRYGLLSRETGRVHAEAAWTQRKGTQNAPLITVDPDIGTTRTLNIPNFISETGSLTFCLGGFAG